MEEISMAQKVEKLGLDVKKFKRELFDLDGKMIDKCTTTLDFSRKNLEENVYPELRKMKEQFGLDIPIGLCGVDLMKLDSKLDSLLWDKEHGKI